MIGHQVCAADDLNVNQDKFGEKPLFKQFGLESNAGVYLHAFSLIVSFVLWFQCCACRAVCFEAAVGCKNIVLNCRHE